MDKQDKQDIQNITANALYIIDTIRPEIENGNLLGVYQYIKHLERLAFYVLVTEERKIQFTRPIIRIPE